jgi:hypothetical protein
MENPNVEVNEFMKGLLHMEGLKRKKEEARIHINEVIIPQMMSLQRSLESADTAEQVRIQSEWSRL